MPERATLWKLCCYSNALRAINPPVASPAHAIELAARASSHQYSRLEPHGKRCSLLVMKMLMLPLSRPRPPSARLRHRGHESDSMHSFRQKRDRVPEPQALRHRPRFFLQKTHLGSVNFFSLVSGGETPSRALPIYGIACRGHWRRHHRPGRV